MFFHGDKIRDGQAIEYGVIPYSKPDEAPVPAMRW